MVGRKKEKLKRGKKMERGLIASKGIPQPISKPGQGLISIVISNKKYVFFGNSDEVGAVEKLPVGQVVDFEFKEGMPNPILTKLLPVTKQEAEVFMGALKKKVAEEGRPADKEDFIIRENVLAHATALMCAQITAAPTTTIPTEAAAEEILHLAAKFEAWVKRSVKGE